MNSHTDLTRLKQTTSHPTRTLLSIISASKKVRLLLQFSWNFNFKIWCSVNKYMNFIYVSSSKLEFYISHTNWSHANWYTILIRKIWNLILPKNVNHCQYYKHVSVVYIISIILWHIIITIFISCRIQYIHSLTR